MITSAETARLAATAERVRTLNAEYAAELTRRDTLIVELSERGEKQRAIGRAAGLSQSGVCSVLART